MGKGAKPRSAGRRRALSVLAKTAAGLVAGSAAGAAIGCGGIVDPRAVTRLPLDELPEGRRMILHAGRRVELLREGTSITARLMICTHEFCDLTWYEPEDNYRCTCHAGKFFPDGSPKSGPVGAPMFAIPTRVEEDTLVIGPAGELSLGG